MSMSHEDIRYRVISKLRESIIQAINNIRTSKPQIYSKLGRQLEEYKQLIERKEDVPLIIKNEKIIKDVGRPDIEVFGGRLLIEVKVKESEFGSGFEQLKRYVMFYPYTEYAITTNYGVWEFYEVEIGKLTKTEKASLESIIEEILIKGVKVPLSTAEVRNMFKPIILLEDELHYIFEIYKVKSEALFEAYRNIISRLYEKASQEDVERLFIKHTLMQMIVSSCLTASSKKKTSPMRACSGVEIEAEIVLPYLKWWESLDPKKMRPPDKEFLNSLLNSIYSRVMLLNWESGGKEDIFRELYEILIDAETRRKIGEYYTPLWLVEFMTKRLFDGIDDLKGITVLDPFCGSGTFLVVAFYRKTQRGQDPDEAIKEVIGFDINPLAVSIARAELMIAYQSMKEGTVTPLIFNVDSASLLLRTPDKWEPTSFISELREIEKRVEYINSPIFGSTEVDFSEILKIEMILRYCFREAVRAEDIKEFLKRRLGKIKSERWKGPLMSHVVNTLAEEKSVDAIARLVEKYGNGVWAVSITSLFAPQIINKVKVDMVITNPPWAQLTEPKGSYGELIRGKARGLLENYEKTGQILAGADISSVLLHGCINIARRRVAFLMPNEVVYTADSYYGLGKILTYNVAKNCAGDIVQVEFDAFQHGRLPCIVFLSKEDGKILCYSMCIEWKGGYSKALHLSDIEYKVKRKRNYRKYINKVALYTQISSKDVMKRLDVGEVVPKGDYIIGLFGGTKKKDAKSYAGLIFDVVGEDKTTEQYSIKLSRTNTAIRIPEYFLDPYWKMLVYTGWVFPFYLQDVHNILLSEKGSEDLRGFLKKRIYRNILEEDKEKVTLLIEELKQPETLRPLKTSKYYVIYRRIRTFASFVLTPDDMRRLSDNLKHEIVVYDACAYITTDDEMKAYYYSTLLNYLAFKVIEMGGAFERNQYLRPLISISEADLQWRGKKWQLDVAKLGKQLHKEAPKCLSGFIERGMRVKECYRRLQTYAETKHLFDSIMKKIDENTSEKRLSDSLIFVCKLKR